MRNVFGGTRLFSIRNNWSGQNANILISTDRFMVDFVAREYQKIFLQSRVWSQTLALVGSVVAGTLINTSGLHFLVCKMGVIYLKEGPKAVGQRNDECLVQGLTYGKCRTNCSYFKSLFNTMFSIFPQNAIYQNGSFSKQAISRANF